MARRVSRRTGAALALAALALGRPLAAQGPKGWELGLQGLVAFQEPVYAGGALAAGYRPGGKARIALGLGAGRADGHLAARGELVIHFMLSPGRLTGTGLYGLGGVAGLAGRHDRGYLVLGLGLEGAPGAPSGWMIEAGVGGGARVSVGWRLRWLERGK